MQSMKAMTKKDIIEFIEEEFKDSRDDDTIASLFQCSESARDAHVKQCIMFHRDLTTPKY